MSMFAGNRKIKILALVAIPACRAPISPGLAMVVD